ncbi:hypothetical protein C8R44DRAFT_853464 [Mycena epipterygia]|nr:hypothetical protein C8R44DRAFT_853464 [Mycena epipterygia]
MRPDSYPLPPSSCPAPTPVLATFPAAMDEWQFPQPHWDGSSEAQRRYAHTFFTDGMLTAQTTAARQFGSSARRIAIVQIPHGGEWPDGASKTVDPAVSLRKGIILPLHPDSRFSSIAATPSINLTGFGHPNPLLFPDLFPGASQPAFHSDFSLPASWDATPFSRPAQFSQQPTETVYDPSVQPHWDDFVSSLQPAPARPPSTGSGAGDFYDGYDIDLMADIGDEYSSSRFPSSILDDGWSSRGWSSNSSRPVSAAPSSVYDDLVKNSPPSISVEIGPWDSAGWTSDDPSSEMFPVRERDLDLVDEVPDMDARLGWEWKPSGVKWLDPEGCPSQFPFYRRRTASFVDLTDMNADNLVCHGRCNGLGRYGRASRVSKRAQADLSGMASLAGWVMQDPHTGEKLTGYEWVKRYPEEFAECYKKDHRRYIEYLAQAEVDS